MQNSNRNNYELSFEAIGTQWIINIYDIVGELDLEDLEYAIEERIELFDMTYSRFREDSLVTLMSKQEGIYKLPPDAEDMFNLYSKLYGLTEGKFNPFMGNVLEDAGYDANYSLKTRTLHQPPNWDQAITYEHPKINIKKPVLFDFGAAGKGYLIDIIGEVLEEYDIKNYCINAGGDILYKGVKNLRVGLENPGNTKQVLGVIDIKNESICGSAGNRRNWGKFHHIINPASLSSPQNVIATWVIADTTMVADALSTCLFFVPAFRLEKDFGFEYLVLNSDYSVDKSKYFDGKLFLNNKIK